MAPTPTQKKYKPNVAIDMVSACLAHYKKFNRPVETITLSQGLFEKWKSGMLERKPDLEIHDQMDFRDVTVRKGSIFMFKDMDVKLKKLVLY